jgi:hypothetical protein
MGTGYFSRLKNNLRRYHKDNGVVLSGEIERKTTSLKPIPDDEFKKFFDDIEPLNFRLSEVKNKTRFSKKYYGLSLKELKYFREYNKKHRGATNGETTKD